MDGFALACVSCGAVGVDIAGVEVHHNRHDDFRLLAATCPVCGEAILSADPATLDRALSSGARRRELLPPVPVFTLDDVDDLRAALADDDWCARLSAGRRTSGESPGGGLVVPQAGVGAHVVMGTPRSWSTPRTRWWIWSRTRRTASRSLPAGSSSSQSR